MSKKSNTQLLLPFNQHLSHLLDLSQRLAQNELFSSKQDKLDKIISNLEQNRFRLVVLGQFKRGKSTFLNSLLGQAILPMDVIPVTAVITEIIFGEQKKAEVFFENGQQMEITLDRLAEFISEEKNPNNQKSVDKVVVHFPAPFLRDGLILVDTPGIGSIHTHNTRLTQEYIPNADAAIFLFSADPPLTELEQNFLQMILPIVPKIFFVLNKKDYISPQALNRVLEFNKKILTQLNNSNVNIFAISALKALQGRQKNITESLKESGLPELEKNLKDYLRTQRARLLILSNCDRLCRIIGETENLILMEQHLQQLSIQKLKQKLKLFNDYIQKIQSHEQNLTFLLQGLQKRLVENLDQKAASFLKETQSLLIAQLKQEMSQNAHLSKIELSRQIERKVNEAIIDRFEPFRLKIEKQIKELYLQEINQINKEVNNIINHIYRYSADLLGLRKISNLPEEKWQFESQFYYRTWEVMTSLDYAEKGFLLLLPKKIFLWLYFRKVQRWIQEKLDRQYGSLRADFLYRLQDNNREYLYAFKTALKNIHQSISDLMEKYIEEKIRDEKKLNELKPAKEKELNLLMNIRAQISDIKNQWTSEKLN